MKNYTLVFITITSVFSFSCFAQRKETLLTNINSENTIVMSDNMPHEGMIIAYYHIEEKTNMAFGGSTRSYNVADLSLVNTNDLGPNGIRVITPKYVKAKVAITNSELSKTPIRMADNIPVKQVKESGATKQVKLDTIVSKPKEKYVNINILDTYERVLSKGYKSVDMLKKIADKHFFENDLKASAQWYTQLFDITTDLDAVYFYRYAQSLTAVGQTEKAKEMMALFEKKKQ